jgi:hypothetical protein
LLCDALRAGSQQLDDRPLGKESYRLADRIQALSHIRVFDLYHLAAVITNQELAGMGMIRMRTTYIGMQRLEFVHQTLLEQKV